MTEFGYILIILFEIILATVIVAFLIIAERKVKVSIDIVTKESKELILRLKKYKEELILINEAFDFMKKINFNSIINKITAAIEIINFLLLIRSFNFKSGLKLTKMAKLIPFNVIRNAILSFKSA